MVPLHYAPELGEWAGRRRASPVSRAMPRTVVDAGAIASLIADSKVPIADGVLVVGEVKTEREVAMLGAIEGAVSYCSDAEVGGVLAELRPGAVYIAGEPTPIRLLGLVSAIFGAVEEVLLVGCWYGYPWFPVSTTAVELIVGSPDWAERSGVWARRVVSDFSRQKLTNSERGIELAGDGSFSGSDAAFTTNAGPTKVADYFAMPLRRGMVSREVLDGVAEGVVVSLTNAGSQQEVIACLLECRTRWAGPMAVVAWRLSIPAVRIVAAHLGVAYLVANEKGLDAASEEDADGEFSGLNFCPACIESCSWLVWAPESPFAKTLIIKPGAKLEGFAPAELLAAVGVDSPIVRRESGTEVFAFDGRSERVATMRWGLRRHLESQQVGPSMMCQVFLHQSKAVKLGSAAAIREKIALPPVWVRSAQRMTVCFSSDALSDAELVEKCAGLRWRGVDAVMMEGAMSKVVDGVAGQFEAIEASPVVEGLSGMLASLWQAVNVATSEWVAVVDGLLKPLPGATFPDLSEAALVMVCPAKQFALEGSDVVTASRLDAPGFLVNRTWMKETMGRILEAGFDGVEDISFAVAAAMEREAVRTGAVCRVETLLDYGWQY